MAQLAGEQPEQVLLDRRRIIKRPRLTRILDKSTARARMLVAPAGYGKTTLAREWLENRAHTWYQGGPATMDVAALAVQLADLAVEIIPGAGDRMRARLRVSNSPDDDVRPLAELLAEDLMGWPEEIWLAFDDYQFAMASEASERFVELLFTLTEIPMLIMSRERPTWVTARRLLYGEVDELSRATLAMNEEEVTELLSAGGGKQALGLLALADGWPAVIGLAASAQRPVPEEIPGALYDFFAEELLNAFTVDEQRIFCRLAVPGVINPPVLRKLFDQVPEEVLQRATQRGVLSSQRKGSYSIHPLLRQYLLDRAPTLDVDLQKVGLELVAFFSESESWDEAFAAIEVANLPDSVPELIRSALPEVMPARRLATLERWLDAADGAGVRSPLCDIARSEVECRKGNPVSAQTLAEHGAAQLLAEDDLQGLALVLAGRAALLSNRTEKAIELYDRARRARHTPESVLYEATWGQFVAAARYESPQALELIETLDSMTNAIPERELRRASARLIAGVRMGSLIGLEDLFEDARPLVDRATDPFVRSSFLLARAQVFALGGLYPQALKATDQALEDLHAHRFDFAIPYTSLVKALAHLGLRQLSQAAGLITESQRLGRERGDVYVQMHAFALEARLLLHQGAVERAAHLLSKPWPSPPEKSMQAEYLATWALALALMGDREGALHQATNASSISQGIEAAVLVAAALAVAAEPIGSRQAAAHVFDVAERTGNFDGLLFASRLSPRLAHDVSADQRQRRVLAALITEIRDYPLARRMGIEGPTVPAERPLTPREQEVYGLLALGMTNREIAKRLFISESTAKVHSMKIREKLGLRSRTEVALHAAQAMQTSEGAHSKES